MTLPSFAAPSDLAAWLNVTIAGSDEARATSILAAASTLLRQETRRSWVDDSNTLTEDSAGQLDALKAVAVMVSARVYQHPDPTVVTEDTSEQLDDHTVANRVAYSAEALAAGLYLTPSERRMLPVNATSGGLWVQPTSRGERLETVYIGADYGDVIGEPVPWTDPYDSPPG